MPQKFDAGVEGYRIVEDDEGEVFIERRARDTMGRPKWDLVDKPGGQYRQVPVVVFLALWRSWKRSQGLLAAPVAVRRPLAAGDGAGGDSHEAAFAAMQEKSRAKQQREGLRP